MNQNQSSQNTESSPTKAAPFRRYRTWLGGLSRGQRIRLRLLQGIGLLAAIALVVTLVLDAWIQVPQLPPVEEQQPPHDVQAGELNFRGAQVPEIARGGRRAGVYTFLLAGRDTAGGGNTDTMILITFDTVQQSVHAMSLPRDTMVNVSSASKRLNSVYNSNKGRDKATQVEKGMTALKTQVAKLTGILPDFYVIVEWEAIGLLVDALGGVSFDVPYNMDYDDPTPGQNLHIHQKAGLRKLTGEDAMQVIRWRKNNRNSPHGYTNGVGDTGRMKIQQDFLMAVAKQCLQVSTILKAPALAQIFKENVTTDLTLGNLLAFAQLANGMKAEQDITFSTLPHTGTYYHGAAMVLPIEAQLLALLNDGLNPYLRDIRATDLELLYKKDNGSYGVRHGTLVDTRLASVPAPSAPEGQPDDTERPDPEEPTPEEQEPTAPPKDEPELPDGSNPEAPDPNPDPAEPPPPEDTAPDNEEPGLPIQTGEPEKPAPSQDSLVDRSQAAIEPQDSLSVLPARPTPVQPAG